MTLHWTTKGREGRSPDFYSNISSPELRRAEGGFKRTEFNLLQIKIINESHTGTFSWSKCDIVSIFFLATESNAYKFVSRTEFVKNNCNPVWKPLEVRKIKTERFREYFTLTCFGVEIF